MFLIKNWRLVVSITFLIIQLGFIISARFHPNRYFVWAPHDIQTEYFIDVYTKKGKLDHTQLKKRYGLQPHGWIDLPPSHIISFLNKYKRLNLNSTSDSISLRYNINGKKWIIWNNVK